MSKRVQSKIKEKHPNVFKWTNKETFSKLLNNTVASSSYNNCEKTLNFISHIKDENKFILYSLKNEKHHTICNTIFSLKPETVKKYYQNKDFKPFNKNIENIIREYIKS